MKDRSALEIISWCFILLAIIWMIKGDTSRATFDIGLACFYMILTIREETKMSKLYNAQWERDYETREFASSCTKEKLRKEIAFVLKKYDKWDNERLELDEISPSVWIVRDVNGCPFATLNLKEVS